MDTVWKTAKRVVQKESSRLASGMRPSTPLPSASIGGIAGLLSLTNSKEDEAVYSKSYLWLHFLDNSTERHYRQHVLVSGHQSTRGALAWYLTLVCLSFTAVLLGADAYVGGGIFTSFSFTMAAFFMLGVVAPLVFLVVVEVQSPAFFERRASDLLLPAVDAYVTATMGFFVWAMQTSLTGVMLAASNAESTLMGEARAPAGVGDGGGGGFNGTNVTGVGGGGGVAAAMTTSRMWEVALVGQAAFFTLGIIQVEKQVQCVQIYIVFFSHHSLQC